VEHVQPKLDLWSVLVSAAAIRNKLDVFRLKVPEACELINGDTSALKFNLKKLFYMSYGTFQCPLTYTASNSRELVAITSKRIGHSTFPPEE